MDDTYDELFKRPSTKKNLYNHFRVSIPNELHQIDLLFLPHDNKYKYALTLVDTASRYKAARPLRTKNSDEVLKNLIDIYDSDKWLDLPDRLNVDKGSEFVNKTMKQFCKDNDIELVINLPSNHLGFVENMNKELAKLIFERQHKEELRTGEVNRIWVKHLQEDVDKLNNRITSMIKMKPIDAIKLDSVPQPKNNIKPKDTKMNIPLGAIVRRLLNKDEVLNISTGKTTVEKRRATDPYWSLEMYEVIGQFSLPDSLVMHQIQDSDGKIYPHLFTFWQLQSID